MRRPFAESCEQNREPILAVLRRYLDESVDSLLEIGSGTGQHAVYFAPEFPWLHWQTSDRRDNHAGIQAWLEAYPSPNIGAPLDLDVVDGEWPQEAFDAVFSANTAHIMDPRAVEAMFAGVAGVLPAGGVFLLYGPFNVDGRYTAPSNERFDRWLQSQDPGMGVRDVGWLNGLASGVGLMPAELVDLPSDNKLLCFKKS